MASAHKTAKRTFPTLKWVHGSILLDVPLEPGALASGCSTFALLMCSLQQFSGAALRLGFVTVVPHRLNRSALLLSQSVLQQMAPWFLSPPLCGKNCLWVTKSTDGQ